MEKLKTRKKSKLVCNALGKGRHCYHQTCHKVHANYGEHNVKNCLNPYKICCVCHKELKVWKGRKN